MISGWAVFIAWDSAKLSSKICGIVKKYLKRNSNLLGSFIIESMSAIMNGVSILLNISP